MAKLKVLFIDEHKRELAQMELAAADLPQPNWRVTLDDEQGRILIVRDVLRHYRARPVLFDVVVTLSGLLAGNPIAPAEEG